MKLDIISIICHLGITVSVWLGLGNAVLYDIIHIAITLLFLKIQLEKDTLLKKIVKIQIPRCHTQPAESGCLCGRVRGGDLYL